MPLKTNDCKAAIRPKTLRENAKTLAVLNGWDLSRVQDYVGRENAIGIDPAKAVSEYRKFIFMALSAKHPCVPSRAVDEVWHAHMLHSRDYTAFCKAMGRDYIHHEPALPGESAELTPHFEKTTAFYEKCFGESPDRAVWGISGEAVCDVQPGADCRGTCRHNCKYN